MYEATLDALRVFLAAVLPDVCWKMEIIPLPSVKG